MREIFQCISAKTQHFTRIIPLVGMNTSCAFPKTIAVSLVASSFLVACDTERVAVNKKAPEPAAATSNVVVTSTPATNQPPPPSVRPAPLVISPALNEIVKLAQAGVGEQVLLTYIQNSPLNYRPSADEIIYLTDLGVPDSVISALMNSGAPLQDRVAGLQPNPAPTTPAPAVTATPTDSSGQPGLVGLTATNPPQGGAPTTATPSPAQSPYIVAQPVESQTTYAQAPAASSSVTVVTQPAAVSYNYFYETLSPYGTWIDYPGHGYCWQPSVAVIDVGWRPYHHRGRWLYTDVGWYWQSDYSWGWAPFHYGRWVNTPRCGWLWTPDTVWAPAWVSWRSSPDYCGWAPLPPSASFVVGVGFRHHGAAVGAGFAFGLRGDDYTFIHHSRLTHRTPWNHYEPAAKNTVIAKDSTVINNYIIGNNNTVINGGIDRERLMAQTKQEIRKTPLQEVNQPQGPAHKADRIAKDGTSLAVYRPQLPTQAPAPPAHVSKKTVDEAVRVANFSTRSELNKAGPAQGKVAQPSKLAPSDLGAAARPLNNNPALSRGSPIPARIGAPQTSTPAPATQSSVRPDRINPAQTRISPTGSSAPNPSLAAPVPAQALTQTPKGTPSGAVQNRAILPSVRPAAAEPRQGLVRPLQNTAAPAAGTSLQAPAAPPVNASQRVISPAANGPSAFRPATPVTTAPAPASGFRQDFRKVEPAPTPSAPAPKFQNFQNNSAQRPLAPEPRNYIAPQQNSSRPTFQRSSPPPSYNPPPQATFQQRPAPSGNSVAPSFRAPAQAAPPASRPQSNPGPGGNSTGGRRIEANKN